ncbi:hypothetical protein HK098_001202 [Nowakowskiella sp. JEL0407]|nr:hypothetical protein HK098_001202 [Nowakowskiella sp. JEL0407]
MHKSSAHAISQSTPDLSLWVDENLLLDNSNEIHHFAAQDSTDTPLTTETTFISWNEIIADYTSALWFEVDVDSQRGNTSDAPRHTYDEYISEISVFYLDKTFDTPTISKLSGLIWTYDTTLSVTSMLEDLNDRMYFFHNPEEKILSESLLFDYDALSFDLDDSFSTFETATSWTIESDRWIEEMESLNTQSLSILHEMRQSSVFWNFEGIEEFEFIKVSKSEHNSRIQSKILVQSEYAEENCSWIINYRESGEEYYKNCKPGATLYPDISSIPELIQFSTSKTAGLLDSINLQDDSTKFTEFWFSGINNDIETFSSKIFMPPDDNSLLSNFIIDEFNDSADFSSNSETNVSAFEPQRERDNQDALSGNSPTTETTVEDETHTSLTSTTLSRPEEDLFRIDLTAVSTAKSLTNMDLTEIPITSILNLQYEDEDIVNVNEYEIFATLSTEITGHTNPYVACTIMSHIPRDDDYVTTLSDIIDEHYANPLRETTSIENFQFVGISSITARNVLDSLNTEALSDQVVDASDSKNFRGEYEENFRTFLEWDTHRTTKLEITVETSYGNNLGDWIDYSTEDYKKVWELTDESGEDVILDIWDADTDVRLVLVLSELLQKISSNEQVVETLQHTKTENSENYFLTAASGDDKLLKSFLEDSSVHESNFYNLFDPETLSENLFAENLETNFDKSLFRTTGPHIITSETNTAIELDLLVKTQNFGWEEKEMGSESRLNLTVTTDLHLDERSSEMQQIETIDIDMLQQVSTSLWPEIQSTFAVGSAFYKFFAAENWSVGVSAGSVPEEVFTETKMEDFVYSISSNAEIIFPSREQVDDQGAVARSSSPSMWEEIQEVSAVFFTSQTISNTAYYQILSDQLTTLNFEIIQTNTQEETNVIPFEKQTRVSIEIFEDANWNDVGFGLSEYETGVGPVETSLHSWPESSLLDFYDVNFETIYTTNYGERHHALVSNEWDKKIREDYSPDSIPTRKTISESNALEIDAYWYTIVPESQLFLEYSSDHSLLTKTNKNSVFENEEEIYSILNDNMLKSTGLDSIDQIYLDEIDVSELSNGKISSGEFIFTTTKPVISQEIIVEIKRESMNANKKGDEGNIFSLAASIYMDFENEDWSTTETSAFEYRNEFANYHHTRDATIRVNPTKLTETFDLIESNTNADEYIDDAPTSYSLFELENNVVMVNSDPAITNLYIAVNVDFETKLYVDASTTGFEYSDSIEPKFMVHYTEISYVIEDFSENFTSYFFEDIVSADSKHQFDVTDSFIVDRKQSESNKSLQTTLDEKPALEVAVETFSMLDTKYSLDFANSGSQNAAISAIYFPENSHEYGILCETLSENLPNHFHDPSFNIELKNSYESVSNENTFSEPFQRATGVVENLETILDYYPYLESYSLSTPDLSEFPLSEFLFQNEGTIVPALNSVLTSVESSIEYKLNFEVQTYDCSFISWRNNYEPTTQLQPSNYVWSSELHYNACIEYMSVVFDDSWTISEIEIISNYNQIYNATNTINPSKTLAAEEILEITNIQYVHLVYYNAIETPFISKPELENSEKFNSFWIEIQSRYMESSVSKFLAPENWSIGVSAVAIVAEDYIPISYYISDENFDYEMENTLMISEIVMSREAETQSSNAETFTELKFPNYFDDSLIESPSYFQQSTFSDYELILGFSITELGESGSTEEVYPTAVINPSSQLVVFDFLLETETSRSVFAEYSQETFMEILFENEPDEENISIKPCELCQSDNSTTFELLNTAYLEYKISTIEISSQKTISHSDHDETNNFIMRTSDIEKDLGQLETQNTELIFEFISDYSYLTEVELVATKSYFQQTEEYPLTVDTSQMRMEKILDTEFLEPTWIEVTLLPTSYDISNNIDTSIFKTPQKELHSEENSFSHDFKFIENYTIATNIAPSEAGLRSQDESEISTFEWLPQANTMIDNFIDEASEIFTKEHFSLSFALMIQDKDQTVHETTNLSSIYSENIRKTKGAEFSVKVTQTVSEAFDVSDDHTEKVKCSSTSFQEYEYFFSEIQTENVHHSEITGYSNAEKTSSRIIVMDQYSMFQNFQTTAETMIGTPSTNSMSVERPRQSIFSVIEVIDSLTSNSSDRRGVLTTNGDDVGTTTVNDGFLLWTLPKTSGNITFFTLVYSNPYEKCKDYSKLNNPGFSINLGLEEMSELNTLRAYVGIFRGCNGIEKSVFHSKVVMNLTKKNQLVAFGIEESESVDIAAIGVRIEISADLNFNLFFRRFLFLRSGGLNIVAIANLNLVEIIRVGASSTSQATITSSDSQFEYLIQPTEIKDLDLVSAIEYSCPLIATTVEKNDFGVESVAVWETPLEINTPFKSEFFSAENEMDEVKSTTTHETGTNEDTEFEVSSKNFLSDIVYVISSGAITKFLSESYNSMAQNTFEYEWEQTWEQTLFQNPENQFTTYEYIENKKSNYDLEPYFEDGTQNHPSNIATADLDKVLNQNMLIETNIEHQQLEFESSLFSNTANHYSFALVYSLDTMDATSSEVVTDWSYSFILDEDAITLVYSTKAMFETSTTETIVKEYELGSFGKRDKSSIVEFSTFDYFDDFSSYPNLPSLVDDEFPENERVNFTSSLNLKESVIYETLLSIGRMTVMETSFSSFDIGHSDYNLWEVATESLTFLEPGGSNDESLAIDALNTEFLVYKYLDFKSVHFSDFNHKPTFIPATEEIYLNFIHTRWDNDITKVEQPSMTEPHHPKKSYEIEMIPEKIFEFSELESGKVTELISQNLPDHDLQLGVEETVAFESTLMIRSGLSMSEFEIFESDFHTQISEFSTSEPNFSIKFYDYAEEPAISFQTKSESTQKEEYFGFTNLEFILELDQTKATSTSNPNAVETEMEYPFIFEFDFVSGSFSNYIFPSGELTEYSSQKIYLASNDNENVYFLSSMNDNPSDTFDRSLYEDLQITYGFAKSESENHGEHWDTTAPDKLYIASDLYAIAEQPEILTLQEHHNSNIDRTTSSKFECCGETELWEDDYSTSEENKLYKVATIYEIIPVRDHSNVFTPEQWTINIQSTFSDIFYWEELTASKTWTLENSKKLTHDVHSNWFTANDDIHDDFEDMSNENIITILPTSIEIEPNIDDKVDIISKFPQVTENFDLFITPVSSQIEKLQPEFEAESMLSYTNKIFSEINAEFPSNTVDFIWVENKSQFPKSSIEPVLSYYTSDYVSSLQYSYIPLDINEFLQTITPLVSEEANGSESPSLWYNPAVMNTEMIDSKIFFHEFSTEFRLETVEMVEKETFDSVNGVESSSHSYIQAELDTSTENILDMYLFLTIHTDLHWETSNDYLSGENFVLDNISERISPEITETYTEIEASSSEFNFHSLEVEKQEYGFQYLTYTWDQETENGYLAKDKSLQFQSADLIAETNTLTKYSESSDVMIDIIPDHFEFSSSIALSCEYGNFQSKLLIEQSEEGVESSQTSDSKFSSHLIGINDFETEYILSIQNDVMETGIYTVSFYNSGHTYKNKSEDFQFFWSVDDTFMESTINYLSKSLTNYKLVISNWFDDDEFPKETELFLQTYNFETVEMDDIPDSPSEIESSIHIDEEFYLSSLPTASEEVTMDSTIETIDDFLTIFYTTEGGSKLINHISDIFESILPSFNFESEEDIASSLSTTDFGHKSIEKHTSQENLYEDFTEEILTFHPTVAYWSQLQFCETSLEEIANFESTELWNFQSEGNIASSFATANIAFESIEQYTSQYFSQEFPEEESTFHFTETYSSDSHQVYENYSSDEISNFGSTELCAYLLDLCADITSETLSPKSTESLDIQKFSSAVLATDSISDFETEIFTFDSETTSEISSSTDYWKTPPSARIISEMSYLETTSETSSTNFIDEDTTSEAGPSLETEITTTLFSGSTLSTPLSETTFWNFLSSETSTTTTNLDEISITDTSESSKETSEFVDNYSTQGDTTSLFNNLSNRVTDSKELSSSPEIFSEITSTTESFSITETATQRMSSFSPYGTIVFITSTSLSSGPLSSTTSVVKICISGQFWLCGKCVWFDPRDCFGQCPDVKGKKLNVIDCFGKCVPIGDMSKYDECGICGGNGNSCRDCMNTVNGTAVVDSCGVCGGSGDSCGFRLDSVSPDIIPNNSQIKLYIRGSRFGRNSKVRFGQANISSEYVNYISPQLISVLLNEKIIFKPNENFRKMWIQVFSQNETNSTFFASNELYITVVANLFMLERAEHEKIYVRETKNVTFLGKNFDLLPRLPLCVFNTSPVQIKPMVTLDNASATCEVPTSDQSILLDVYFLYSTIRMDENLSKETVWAPEYFIVDENEKPISTSIPVYELAPQVTDCRFSNDGGSILLNFDSEFSETIKKNIFLGVDGIPCSEYFLSSFNANLFNETFPQPHTVLYGDGPLDCTITFSSFSEMSTLKKRNSLYSDTVDSWQVISRPYMIPIPEVNIKIPAIVPSCGDLTIDLSSTQNSAGRLFSDAIFNYSSASKISNEKLSNFLISAAENFLSGQSVFTIPANLVLPDKYKFYFTIINFLGGTGTVVVETEKLSRDDVPSVTLLQNRAKGTNGYITLTAIFDTTCVVDRLVTKSYQWEALDMLDLSFPFNSTTAIIPPGKIRPSQKYTFRFQFNFGGEILYFVTYIETSAENLVISLGANTTVSRFQPTLLHAQVWSNFPVDETSLKYSWVGLDPDYSEVNFAGNLGSALIPAETFRIGTYLIYAIVQNTITGAQSMSNARLEELSVVSNINQTLQSILEISEIYPAANSPKFYLRGGIYLDGVKISEDVTFRFDSFEECRNRKFSRLQINSNSTKSLPGASILKFRQNTAYPGALYCVAMTAKIPNLDVPTSTIEFKVRSGPRGGFCELLNSVITFPNYVSVRCFGWTTDDDALPLSYTWEIIELDNPRKKSQWRLISPTTTFSTLSALIFPGEYKLRVKISDSVNGVFKQPDVFNLTILPRFSQFGRRTTVLFSANEILPFVDSAILKFSETRDVNVAITNLASLVEVSMKVPDKDYRLVELISREMRFLAQIISSVLYWDDQSTAPLLISTSLNFAYLNLSVGDQLQLSVVVEQIIRSSGLFLNALGTCFDSDAAQEVLQIGEKFLQFPESTPANKLGPILDIMDECIQRNQICGEVPFSISSSKINRTYGISSIFSDGKIDKSCNIQIPNLSEALRKQDLDNDQCSKYTCSTIARNNSLIYAAHQNEIVDDFLYGLTFKNSTGDEINYWSAPPKVNLMMRLSDTAQNLLLSPNKNLAPMCAYISNRELYGSFSNNTLLSNNGCSVVFQNISHISCFCNHLTDFVIVFRNISNTTTSTITKSISTSQLSGSQTILITPTIPPTESTASHTIEIIVGCAGGIGLISVVALIYFLKKRARRKAEQARRRVGPVPLDDHLPEKIAKAAYHDRAIDAVNEKALKTKLPPIQLPSSVYSIPSAGTFDEEPFTLQPSESQKSEIYVPRVQVKGKGRSNKIFPEFESSDSQISGNQSMTKAETQIGALIKTYPETQTADNSPIEDNFIINIPENALESEKEQPWPLNI